MVIAKEKAVTGAVGFFAAMQSSCCCDDITLMSWFTKGTERPKLNVLLSVVFFVRVPWMMDYVELVLWKIEKKILYYIVCGILDGTHLAGRVDL